MVWQPSPETTLYQFAHVLITFACVGDGLGRLTGVVVTFVGSYGGTDGNVGLTMVVLTQTQLSTGRAPQSTAYVSANAQHVGQGATY